MIVQIPAPSVENSSEGRMTLDVGSGRCILLKKQHRPAPEKPNPAPKHTVRVQGYSNGFDGDASTWFTNTIPANSTCMRQTILLIQTFHALDVSGRRATAGFPEPLLVQRPVHHQALRPLNSYPRGTHIRTWDQDSASSGLPLSTNLSMSPGHSP